MPNSDAVFGWAVLPALLYVVNVLDRVNAGFAALAGCMIPAAFPVLLPGRIVRAHEQARDRTASPGA